MIRKSWYWLAAALLLRVAASLAGRGVLPAAVQILLFSLPTLVVVWSVARLHPELTRPSPLRMLALAAAAMLLHTAIGFLSTSAAALHALAGGGVQALGTVLEVETLWRILSGRMSRGALPPRRLLALLAGCAAVFYPVQTLTNQLCAAYTNLIIGGGSVLELYNLMYCVPLRLFGTLPELASLLGIYTGLLLIPPEDTKTA